MDTTNTDTRFNELVGSLRPDSELLDQLLTLRAARRRLEAENASLRQLLLEQHEAIERYIDRHHR